MNRGRSRSTCTLGGCSKPRGACKCIVGGRSGEAGDRIPCNLVGEGDGTGSNDHSDDQAEELEENARENAMERLNNMKALTAEAEAGAALDSATAKAEDVRAKITEGNANVLTIEYSPEWGGTMIEEE